MHFFVNGGKFIKHVNSSPTKPASAALSKKYEITTICRFKSFGLITPFSSIILTITL